MDTDDITQTAEAIDRLATDMIRALQGIKPPSRDNPMFGVAGSALSRCRQIAEQVLHLSGEAISQMRTFENSERRGRELVEMRSAAKKKRDSAVKPTNSRRVATLDQDVWTEEEDPWDDEL